MGASGGDRAPSAGFLLGLGCLVSLAVTAVLVVWGAAPISKPMSLPTFVFLLMGLVGVTLAFGVAWLVALLRSAGRDERGDDEDPEGGLRLAIGFVIGLVITVGLMVWLMMAHGALGTP